MSETPSDEELLDTFEQYYLAQYEDESATDLILGLRAVFNAGRASVTPPTREAIADTIWRTNAHDVGDDYLAGDSVDWLPEADAVLSLFAVPPTESENRNG